MGGNLQLDCVRLRGVRHTVRFGVGGAPAASQNVYRELTLDKKAVIRLLVVLLLGGAAVVGVFVYKSGESDALQAKSRASAESLLTEGLTDNAEREYLRGLIAFVHPEAWKVAFKPEGLTGGTVDMVEYQRAIAERAAERAQSDGQKNVANHLNTVKQELVERDAGMP